MVYIGTSGWHYKHWLGDFYPKALPSSQMLSQYARHFSTVEINNSFYRLPRKEDIERWRETVPDDFCFSVKASRYITHRKRLHDTNEAVRTFLDRAGLLGLKLGPILFQLPPNWRPKPGRLEQFISTLPGSCRYVFEFRDLRWYSPEVYAVLERYQAALCLHDWRLLDWPKHFTSDFTYVRFHGPSGSYGGSYSAASLRGWATLVAGWRRHLKDVFLYFNNDREGHAVKNAQFIAGLLHPKTKELAA